MAGRPEGIAPLPNFDPMVEIPRFSCQPKTATSAVAPSIATIDPGTLRKPSRGQNMITARQPTASNTEGTCMSPK
jgi:hypothetical protein